MLKRYHSFYRYANGWANIYTNVWRMSGTTCALRRTWILQNLRNKLGLQQEVPVATSFLLISRCFHGTRWRRNRGVHNCNNTLLYCISGLTFPRTELQKLNNPRSAHTNRNHYEQVKLQKEVKTVFKYSKLWIRLHYARNVHSNRKHLIVTHTDAWNNTPPVDRKLWTL